MRELSLTVSQLNEYVRRSLAADPMLRGVSLTGEISNFKRHVSGHWYFTLKDEEAAINCAMFRQSAASVRFRPENGQRVKLTGTVGLYSKTGSYQFYADSMEQAGVGDLYLQFEALKRKLSNEGLFDASLKKPVPFLPRGVGVVTSKTGAVVHDIARVSWRRFPGMTLYLCPVKVQGEGAAREIANGLLLLDSMPEVDVIIVGRGGGSMEDLWAFNEERVARAIALCQTPVISAVGHETDFTIADFVADLRAATPSAAAELAVPERESLEAGIQLMMDKLHSHLQRRIDSKRLCLTEVQKRLTATSPAERRERMASSLAAAQLRVQAAMRQAFDKRLGRLEQALSRMHPAMDNALLRKRHRLENAALHMRTASPVETMKRGYAVVTRDGSLVRSAQTLHPGDRLTVRFAEGSAHTIVHSIGERE